MNKVCSKCSATVDAEANFCQNCGSADFQAMDETTSSIPEIGNPQKSGIKWWQAALIVVAIVLLVPTVVGLIFGTVNNSAYTKGTFENGVYVNEWANMTFEVTAAWPEGTSEIYESFEDGYTECGFVSYDEYEGRSFALCFERMYGELIFSDIDGYLDDIIESMEESLSEYPTTDYTLDARYFRTIAGEQYKCLRFKYYGLTHCFYGRIHDGYVILFVGFSSDERDLEEFIANIEKVNEEN